MLGQIQWLGRVWTDLDLKGWVGMYGQTPWLSKVWTDHITKRLMWMSWSTMLNRVTEKSSRMNRS